MKPRMACSRLLFVPRLPSRRIIAATGVTSATALRRARGFPKPPSAMKDFSRIALLASLVLLVVALTYVLPQFHFFHALHHLKDALPWVLIGLFFLCFRGRGCCGSWGCAPRRQPAAKADA